MTYYCILYVPVCITTTYYTLLVVPPTPVISEAAHAVRQWSTNSMNSGVVQRSPYL